MRRREVVTLLGAAAAWPLVALAQQQKAPIVGLLHGGSPEAFAGRMKAFRQGLADGGFVEGRNIEIEYRWANNDFKRLPKLAADLVAQRVAVIAVPGAGSGSLLAAKAATQTIPIVFSTGADPVQLGYVASLNRPGGNVTGINDMNSTLTLKRLSIISELLPGARKFAVLLNPSSAEADPVAAEIKAATSSFGRHVDLVFAASASEIEGAFSKLHDNHTDGLVIHTNALFNELRIPLTTLAAHHRIPTIYPWREAAEIGGLIFYGTSGTDEYRQVGGYVGRVLQGERPADLPVVRAAKFELVINLQTARTLGIQVPSSLLAVADQAIE